MSCWFELEDDLFKPLVKLRGKVLFGIDSITLNDKSLTEAIGATEIVAAAAAAAATAAIKVVAALAAIIINSSSEKEPEGYPSNNLNLSMEHDDV